MSTVICRRAGVPACETLGTYTADARPPLNSTVIPIKLGDIVDVGILWGDWLKASKGRLKSSTWAAAGAPVASPQTPTFVGSGLVDKSAGETVCLIDTTAAAVGDTYYVENTVVVEVDPAASPLAYPDRTLIRRLHVKVAAG